MFKKLEDNSEQMKFVMGGAAMDIESKIADLSFESSIVPMKYKLYENPQNIWVFGTDS